MVLSCAVETNSKQFISTQLPSVLLQVSANGTMTTVTGFSFLQRYKRPTFAADTVLSVTELQVLPECNYDSGMSYVHKVKKYGGHKEVYVYVVECIILS